MPHCLIGLGSNVGDRAESLLKAVERLQAEPALHVTAVSRWRQTAAIGGPVGQGAFLNGAMTLETSLSPTELLQKLRQIENDLGRTREVRWGARSVDLDLLLFGEEQIDTPLLQVPHPRMAFRRFVLAPAADIAGDMRHPQIRWTIGELLANLDRRPRYVAIASLPGADKARLAQELAAATRGRLIVDPAPLSLLAGAEIDSTVQTLGPHVESLVRRRAALDLATWPPNEGLAISDFAWCESLAVVEACLPAAAYRRFEERWQAESAGMLAPTLTLFLDAGPKIIATRPERSELDTEFWRRGELGERLKSAWRRAVFSPGAGPCLRLPGEDFAAALNESQAAVAAMGN